MNERYDRFTALVAAISQDIQKIKMLEMQKFGLKSGHVSCLHRLYGTPEGLTPGQLTELCDIDKAAVSRYLTDLSDKGLITRVNDGNRKYNRRWSLTEQGQQIAAETDMRINTAVGYVGSFLTDRERGMLYEWLDRISRNLDRYIEERK